MSTPIVCSDRSFIWPDGRTVFDGLNLSISTAGLVSSVPTAQGNPRCCS